MNSWEVKTYTPNWLGLLNWGLNKLNLLLKRWVWLNNIRIILEAYLPMQHLTALITPWFTVHLLKAGYRIVTVFQHLRGAGGPLFHRWSVVDKFCGVGGLVSINPWFATAVSSRFSVLNLKRHRPPTFRFNTRARFVDSLYIYFRVFPKR